MQLTEHFADHEFECPCGECEPTVSVDLALLIVLEAIRSEFAVPVTVNSGIRCIAYNRSIGGAKNSQHLYGRAADIWLPSTPARAVQSWIDRQPWRGRVGMGHYDNFTHIDTRGTRARWTG